MRSCLLESQCTKWHATTTAPTAPEAAATTTVVVATVAAPVAAGTELCNAYIDVELPLGVELEPAAQSKGKRARKDADDGLSAAWTAAEDAGYPFFLYTEGYRSEPPDTLAHDVAFADFRELPKKIRTFISTL